MATPIGIKKHAAIVFIPVRSVTVAEPPKISMEETMMFVANLRTIHPSEIRLDQVSPPRKDSPEEEKYSMGELSPASTNDFEPSVSVRGIKFKLGGELMGSPRIRVSFPTLRNE
jgi:hypothetical protein